MFGRKGNEGMLDNGHIDESAQIEVKTELK